MEGFLVPIALAVCCVLGICAYARRLRRGGSCCGAHEPPEKRVRPADRDKSRYPYRCALTIDGMTCSNCVRRVENALNSMDGVWCTVDLGRRRALLRLKQRPDERALRGAVRAAGYPVLSIDAGAEG